MSKKNNPSGEGLDELYELWKRMEKAQPGKKAREIHRRLKGYGYRVSLFDRYPNMPLIISIIALLVVLAKGFLEEMI